MGVQRSRGPVALPAMLEAKEMWAGGEQGRDAASRTTQLPSAPHPQQPPQKGILLSWQEAKGGLRSHGQEGWILGHTHGMTGEAPPRLSTPPALPALDLRSLHPAGYHHFATSRRGGEGAVRVQLASSSTGRGRRTGWVVWEGHFSLAYQFPSFQAVSGRAWLLHLWEHCRGLGGASIGLLLAAGHLPLASWPQGRGHGGPRSGSVCITRGPLQGLSGSNRRGRFPSLAPSSKQRSADVRVTGAAQSAAPHQLLHQLRSLGSFLVSPAATISKQRGL